MLLTTVLPNKTSEATMIALDTMIVVMNSLREKSDKPKLILTRKLGVNGKIVNKNNKPRFCFATHSIVFSICLCDSNLIKIGLFLRYLKNINTVIAPVTLPIQEKK